MNSIPTKEQLSDLIIRGLNASERERSYIINRIVSYHGIDPISLEGISTSMLKDRLIFLDGQLIEKLMHDEFRLIISG